MLNCIFVISDATKTLPISICNYEVVLYLMFFAWYILMFLLTEYWHIIYFVMVMVSFARENSFQIHFTAKNWKALNFWNITLILVDGPSTCL